VTTQTEIPWTELLEFEASDLPVVSLYLDTRPDENNKKSRQEYFLRNELHPMLETYDAHTPARSSMERDVERIQRYVDEELRASADSLAIFACSGAGDFFVAIPLDVPLERSELHVYHRPHLYPLLRLTDQYPRYAAVLLDSHTARIHVFGLNTSESSDRVDSRRPMQRTDVGGYSQKRYQRHVDNWREQHAKEVAETLEALLREEGIDRVVLAGDEVAIPLLEAQLPPHVKEKVLDVVRLDIRAPEHELLEETLEALRAHDARTDAEKVDRLIDEYRAGGLATVGVDNTLEALARGQVRELLVSTDFDRVHGDREVVRAHLVPPLGDAEEVPADPNAEREVNLAAELTARARNTDASVTFVEDVTLLSAYEGVGAFLRYRI